MTSKSKVRSAAFVLWAAVLAGQAPMVAHAAGASDPAAIAKGQRIVEQDCSGCHAIGREGHSPLPKAPLFRELHRRYDVEDLAEALAEGIVAGHPAMPAKPYEPGEVNAIIAYLRSLEPTELKPGPVRPTP